MSKLKVGDKFEMTWPFSATVHKASSGNALFAKRDGFTMWSSGCDATFEQYDEGRGEMFLTAHGEGKVIYKILSVVEMPSRYQDRIIFKRLLINPVGKKYNNGEVRTVTVNSFKKDINSITPFKGDYELELLETGGP